MQHCLVIEKLAPQANPTNYDVTIFADGEWQITRWDLDSPQPSKEDIEDYWEAHKAELLTPHTSPEEQTQKRLEETENAILILMDMMGGV